MIQSEGAGIAVLSGHLHLRFQTLEDLLHVVGLTGHRLGLGDGLDIHPNLVLPRHIQQVIEAAIPLKILGGDLGWVVCQGQLVHFLDPGAVSFHILLHRCGVVAGALLRFDGQSGDCCRQDQGQSAHRGLLLRYFPFYMPWIILSFFIDRAIAPFPGWCFVAAGIRSSPFPGAEVVEILHTPPGKTSSGSSLRPAGRVHRDPGTG